MNDLDDETLVSFYRRLDKQEEELGKLRDQRVRDIQRIADLNDETKKLRDELAMYRSALDDWDWAGLVCDAKRGDFESAASALATIARVDEARSKETK